MVKTRSVDPEIQQMLDASGLEWHTEFSRRHQKLFVAGRMIQVLPLYPRTGQNPRGDANARANVRRYIRSLKCPSTP